MRTETSPAIPRHVPHGRSRDQGARGQPEKLAVPRRHRRPRPRPGRPDRQPGDRHACCAALARIAGLVITTSMHTAWCRPGPADRRPWMNTVLDVTSEPLDRGRPLWQAWYLTGLADGRSALVLRLHHAVMDGMGMIALQQLLFDVAPSPVCHDPSPRRWSGGPTLVVATGSGGDSQPSGGQHRRHEAAPGQCSRTGRRPCPVAPPGTMRYTFEHWIKFRYQVFF